jgi:hypothetical protein
MKPASQRQKSRYRKPTSKELDLLLLAGCSCLLTVLYHPVADALQSIQSGSQAQGAISSQVSRVPQQAGSIYLTLPPKREEVKEEEEEQA